MPSGTAGGGAPGAGGMPQEDEPGQCGGADAQVVIFLREIVAERYKSGYTINID